MKKLAVLLFFGFLMSCSTDNATGPNGDAKGDGTGGSLARFTLAGDYLYTVDDQSLRIFDISNRDKPEFVNEKYIGFDIETLYSLGENLFVGSRLGMFIYDISDPEFPLQLSEVQHVRSCDPVVSDGSYAYVTLHTNVTCEGIVNQLEIYDVENPMDPTLLNTIQMDRPIGLGLYGDNLLVTDEGVVRIFDVTIPAVPDLIGGIPVDGFDLIIKQDHLYVIGPEALYQYRLNSENVEDFENLSKFTF
ncbi:hypothetical protein [Christiangramia sp. SM2212]|uniref:LVIVD repeat-containing protein n=1 Tax=Christiangramia sediminicola TaxID=3073267 RepID=A0ABU1ER24_9FLAO|nr:hypothetical protein [Christiangramia sp. SM2212]MDR5590847.1 hypothetical protein [Christiangramia sp. SM2212]